MTAANGKKKVLVIDDDETQLVAIESLLKAEFDVTCMKSGKEARECLMRDYVPEIILLDILMPQMDGWETFNTIRGISLLKDVPIVFITATGGGGEQRALELGAADYIEKPIYKEDLIGRLTKILQKDEAKSPD